MGRDHRKLRVFSTADDLVVEIYHVTRGFPDSERFGLQTQLRRAAVSAAANIVEGSARRTTREYIHFLSMANASAAEARYLIELSHRLGLMSGSDGQSLVERYSRLMRGLQKLVNTLASPLRQAELKPKAESPEPIAYFLVMVLMTTASTGTSPGPVFTDSILSTTSMPSITFPNTA